VDNSFQFDVLEARVKDNKRLGDVEGLKDIKVRTEQLYRNTQQALTDTQARLRREEEERKKREEWNRKLNAEQALRDKAKKREWQIYFFDESTGAHTSTDGEGMYTLQEAMLRIKELEGRRWNTLKYIPVHMPEPKEEGKYIIRLNGGGERSSEWPLKYTEEEANNILRTNKYGPNYYYKVRV